MQESEQRGPVCRGLEEAHQCGYLRTMRGPEVLPRSTGSVLQRHIFGWSHIMLTSQPHSSLGPHMLPLSNSWAQYLTLRADIDYLDWGFEGKICQSMCNQRTP